MSTILDKLKLYFQNNSKEEIEKNWAESEKFDKIGPTVDEFIEQTCFHHSLESFEEFWEFKFLNDITENPKFASDFFLDLN